VISVSHSPWRLASMAVVLGLLGTCAVAVSVADSPKGSARARGGGRAAAAFRTGLRLAAPQPATAAGSGSARSGLLLMSQAAAASEQIPYRGVQIVVWWGQDGTTASFVQVWHRTDSTALTEAPATAAVPSAAQQPSGGPLPDVGGILDVSPRMLALMEANYRIGYSGRGTADSRSADIVELRRPDGSLAATFWLDAATKLPLRREIYTDGTRMISVDAFVDLQIGRRGLGSMPAAGAQPWSSQLDLARLTALRAAGWPLPGSLAGDLALYRASETAAHAGPVLDLCYSDGLSVVSLFLQRGQLPQAMSGWRRVTVHGHSVFSNGPDDRSLAWSADGFVFTVIADADPATVGQVVAELPHQSQTGFWSRMARGFRRLASWADPFR
jgi:sigma-E factor negative regulatory protein RseB